MVSRSPPTAGPGAPGLSRGNESKSGTLLLGEGQRILTMYTAIMGTEDVSSHSPCDYGQGYRGHGTAVEADGHTQCQQTPWSQTPSSCTQQSQTQAARLQGQGAQRSSERQSRTRHSYTSSHAQSTGAFLLNTLDWRRVPTPPWELPGKLIPA